MNHQRTIVWIGSCKKDLKSMPLEVQDDLGYALDLAQRGGRVDYAVPMKGDLRDVIEVRAHDETGDSTFRVMYTVKFVQTVYVLHAFHKKSHKGRETRKHDLDLIRKRLAEARAHHER